MKPAVTTKATLSDKLQEIFYIHFPTDRTAHTTAFDGPVGDHWLEREIAQTGNALAMQAQSNDLNLYRRVLYGLSFVLLPVLFQNAITAIPKHGF